MTKRRCRLMKFLYIICYVVTCLCVAYSIFMLLESCDTGLTSETKIVILLVLLLAFFIVMLVLNQVQLNNKPNKKYI